MYRRGKENEKISNFASHFNMFLPRWQKEINAVQNAGLVSVHIDDDYQILEKKAEEQKENAKEIKNVIDRIQKSYTKDAEGEPVSINIYFLKMEWKK